MSELKLHLHRFITNALPGYKYNIPISTLHNLIVKIRIYMLHGNTFHLKVESEYERYIYYSKNFVNEMMLDDRIDSLIYTLCNLFRHSTVDDLTGKIIVDDVHYNELLLKNTTALTRQFIEEFKDDKTIELNAKECCVCNTWTQTRIEECNHFVCISCVSKLYPSYSDEYEGVNLKKCPLCREEITGLV
jgi:hypothetical protein